MARDLINSVASKAQFRAGDRVVGHRACPFGVVVKGRSSEGVTCA